jgi:hypothetical protein
MFGATQLEGQIGTYPSGTPTQSCLARHAEKILVQFFVFKINFGMRKRSFLDGLVFRIIFNVLIFAPDFPKNWGQNYLGKYTQKLSLPSMCLCPIEKMLSHSLSLATCACRQIPRARRPFLQDAWGQGGAPQPPCQAQ